MFCWIERNDRDQISKLPSNHDPRREWGVLRIHCHTLEWTVGLLTISLIPVSNLRCIDSAPVIPSLSLGLSLSSHYLPPEKLDSFMRRMLTSRISRRVLAEHHIALSETFSGRGRQTNGEPHVGIIFTGLNVKRTVDHCTRLLKESPLWIANPSYPSGNSNQFRRPDVRIDGHIDTSFAYIREHLEWVS